VSVEADLLDFAVEEFDALAHLTNWASSALSALRLTAESDSKTTEDESGGMNPNVLLCSRVSFANQ
jgi:hypothetical protein